MCRLFNNIIERCVVKCPLLIVGISILSLCSDAQFPTPEHRELYRNLRRIEAVAQAARNALDYGQKNWANEHIIHLRALITALPVEEVAIKKMSRERLHSLTGW